MTFGPIAPSHRSRIREILESAGNFTDDEIEVALELFDSGVGSPDYVFLGAFDHLGALRGFACFGPTPSTDRTFDLYWIAVDRAAQGSGVGGLLLAEVEVQLRALDARMVLVETSSRSEYDGARSFYANRGYAEVARVREFYAPGDDRLLFTKRFNNASHMGHGATTR
jgi:ribosomal protein S18 acetylase RimI-like enzyme